jgi:opacity protein-like surface antigen
VQKNQEDISMKIPPARLRTCPSKLLSAVTTLVVSVGIQTASAQTATTQIPDQPATSKPVDRSADYSFGVFGQLTTARQPVTVQNYSSGTQIAGTVTNQLTQGASPSAGVLGTFHQALTSRFGYNVNAGYTRFSENYSDGISANPASGSSGQSSAQFVRGTIDTNMVELTVASVIEGPRTKRFSTFAQFGGGGLFFTPASGTTTFTSGTVDPKSQIRPAMLFGVGMNYKLSSHLGLRAEYRGLFYKSPDFNLPPYEASDPASFPMSRLFTVINTPAISLVYRFGGAKQPTKTTNSR